MSQETGNAENANVVVDKAKSSLSDLWTKEDYWAIWIGLAFCFLALSLYVFSYPEADKKAALEKIAKAEAIMTAEAAKAPFKTIAWYDRRQAKKFRPSPAPLPKHLIHT